MKKSFLLLAFVFINGIPGIPLIKKTNHLPANTSSNVVAAQRKQIASLISENLKIDEKKLLDAAEQLERGNVAGFDKEIYEVGIALNRSIEKTLQLSPSAKIEMDSLLAENYPEIAKEVREKYLKNILVLKDKPKYQYTKTDHSTRAEVISAAFNSTLCSFSNLILLPLNPSLTVNIAAGYFFYDPCESLLSGVSDVIGEGVFRMGLMKDINETQVYLKAEKYSEIADLTTAKMEFKVSSIQRIKRSIGHGRLNLGSWDAGSLTIKYLAEVNYGFDLSKGFKITLLAQTRELLIELSAPKLIALNLEPLSTDLNDDGISDIGTAEFRDNYLNAQNQALTFSKKNNIEAKAKVSAEKILTELYSPLIANKKYAYKLKFNYIKTF
ncbi:DUF4230 domain-containing protein [Pedobacter aquatilis]|uniref:DUF4230 domain-containing protein n=1 Tax=Pedobacter aquatilis TaxID=351343 RepID=UPI00292FE76F|nr:DUF4230 domain-containing protein [Pedobacter aquatilis]